MTEKTRYEKIKLIEGIEIRRYPRLALATVRELNDDSAFGILFNYITGQNRSKKKISMTAPVISSRRGEGEKIEMTAPVVSDDNSFSFVLPSNYSIENAPVPLDKHIIIEDIKEGNIAVLWFKGRTPEKKIDIMKEDLMRKLSNNNVKTIGKPFLMRYNSPFTPGFMRRNEIGIELE